MTRSNRRTRRGFTLVELLAVVVILGLLTTTLVVAVRGSFGEAKSKIAKTRIGIIVQAIETYALEQGRLPTMDEGLEILAEKPVGRSDGYIKRGQLKDPWGNTFLYRVPGRFGEYEVYTYGRDGLEGGDGEDKDVSSEDEEAEAQGF